MSIHAYDGLEVDGLRLVCRLNVSLLVGSDCLGLGVGLSDCRSRSLGIFHSPAYGGERLNGHQLACCWSMACIDAVVCLCRICWYVEMYRVECVSVVLVFLSFSFPFSCLDSKSRWSSVLGRANNVGVTDQP